MTTLAIAVDTTELKQVADRIGRIDARLLGSAALLGVNKAAAFTRQESVRRILSGVNLSQGYVEERLELEEATQTFSPEAVIVAPRRGGRRRPGTRPVNLIQYAAVQVTAPVRFPNSLAAGKVWRMKDGRQGAQLLNNPRKPGSKLPFVLRTGAPALSIPVGMKQAGVTVEVLKGERKSLKNAFIQRMPNGQTLVMENVGPGGKSKKGRINALYSLSVWQMFRRQIPNVAPLARERLQQEVGNEVIDAIEKVLP